MATAASPARQFATMLARFDPAVAKLSRAALRRMRARLPGATELVYDNYNGLVVGFSPTTRPSDAVFSLAIFPDHATLVFIRGIDVPDPKRRLSGGGNQVRHIRLQSAATLDEPDVVSLMRAAMKRAPPFPDAPRRLVIQSVSAKQRPRRRPTAR